MGSSPGSLAAALEKSESPSRGRVGAFQSSLRSLLQKERQKEKDQRLSEGKLVSRGRAKISLFLSSQLFVSAKRNLPRGFPL